MSAFANSGSSGSNDARPSGMSGKTSPTLKTDTLRSDAMAVAPLALEGEEGRLVRALEIDVEAQHVAFLPGDQQVAILLGNELEHGVGAVGLGLIGEVNARQRLLEQATGEHRHVQVRREHLSTG